MEPWVNEYQRITYGGPSTQNLHNRMTKPTRNTCVINRREKVHSLVQCTLKRIRNIYSQNPNSATSLPNTKFIFPKQIFYNSMWSIFTNEAEGQSVGSDQHHAQTHKCLILPAGIAKCSQQTSSFQVRLHGLPFPAPIMVKISPTRPLFYSGASQDANQGQHSSFLPHLSVPPLLQNRCTVHSHLCGTQNT